jgi:diguanylate cyclase (GGDEF)-like protein/PAS domain S-box-containing protein
VPDPRPDVRPTTTVTSSEAARSLMAEYAPVVLGLVDADERLVDIDGALLSTQQTWRHRLGRRLSEIIVDEAMIEMVRDGLRGDARVGHVQVNGRPWLFAVRPVHDDGRVTHAAVMLTYADVTAVHRELTASDAANQRFTAVIELSNSFVSVADLQGRVTYLNRAGRELVGLGSEEEALDRPMRDYFTEAALDQADEFSATLQSQGSWQGETTLRHFGTGEEIPVAVDAFVVTGPTETAPLGLAMVHRDLRPQLRAEAALARRIHEQQVVAEVGRLALSLPLAELMTQAVRLVHGRYPELVPGVLKLHGTHRLEMVACSEDRWVSMAVPMDDSSLTGRAITSGRTLRSDDLDSDDRFPSANAARATFSRRSMLCSPIAGDAPAWGVVGVSGDAPVRWTDDDQTFIESVAATLSAAVRRDQLEGQLQHQALHDPLTGLPNRALVVDRIGHALSTSARHGTTMAVLLLDVDDFKSVNDVLGHGNGDRLLVELALRLKEAVRDCDTVARLGGDEFVVVCEDLSRAEDVAFVAEALLQACAAGVDLAGRRLSVTASVGVALCVAGEATTTSLVSEADIAMYRAKRDRPGSYRIFDEAMRGDVTGRINVAGELRAAVRADRIEVAFQPIVDLDDGWVVGMEALARWTNDAGEVIAPDLFIAVAEETGIIGELGAAVLRRAAREAVTWQGPREVALRVNASGHELRSPSYVDQVLATLAETGLPARLLGVEITESVFVDEDRLTRENLSRLREAGVCLLIDDFGTGYSSLSYLQRFPVVDVLKVDRTFLDAGSRGEAVVEAVTGLGDAFGMQVCAEGVETPAQHARVVEMGCRLAQGYLLGRPQPPDRARSTISEWQPVRPSP